MANADAFSSGFDAGMGNTKKKRTDSNDKGPKKNESTFMKVLHHLSPISNLHKGGLVKRTGNYRLKAGERVLTVKQQKQYGINKGGKKKATSRKRVASKG